MGTKDKTTGRPRAATYESNKPCARGHFLRYTRNDDCAACERQRHHEYHKRNAIVIRQRSARWKKENPDKVRASQIRSYPQTAVRQRAWRQKNLDRIRALRWKRQGLEPPTPPTERCEICKGISSKHLCLDHDHKTGKFRGWLCYECNLALGLIKDSIDNLRAAIVYLSRRQ